MGCRPVLRPDTPPGEYFILMRRTRDRPASTTPRDCQNIFSNLRKIIRHLGSWAADGIPCRTLNCWWAKTAVSTNDESIIFYSMFGKNSILGTKLQSIFCKIKKFSHYSRIFILSKYLQKWSKSRCHKREKVPSPKFVILQNNYKCVFHFSNNCNFLCLIFRLRSRLAEEEISEVKIICMRYYLWLSRRLQMQIWMPEMCQVFMFILAVSLHMFHTIMHHIDITHHIHHYSHYYTHS